MALRPTSTWRTASRCRSGPPRASWQSSLRPARSRTSTWSSPGTRRSIQGKTFALPFDTDARALFYNKDLIEAAGEDPAKLDIANGPATIDEVLAIADKITKEDASGNYETMGWIPGGPGPGGQPGAIDQGWHYTWGFAHGGKFADTAACKVTPTDPGVVAGFQFLYDLAKERDPEKITRFVSTNMPDPTNPAQQNAFITGKLAMVVTGDWRIDEMAKYSPDTNYGFTYIPVPNEGDESATWAGGWSVALIPDSEAPDQAWKFMQYFAGPEGQKVYTKETKHLPTLSALLDGRVAVRRAAQDASSTSSTWPRTGRRWRSAPPTGTL